MTPSIRPAHLDDVPALLQLRMANAERHATLNRSHYRFPEATAVQRYFTDRISRPPSRLRKSDRMNAAVSQAMAEARMAT